MLSLLNPASAPAAAAQAPGLAARGDNRADGGAEFAKALEQSNSRWQNQASIESTARPAAPLQRRQGQDDTAPAAHGATGSRARNSAADKQDGESGSSADAVESVSEVLVRLAISHLLLPTASPEAAARTTAEVLGPYISHVEALSRP